LRVVALTDGEHNTGNSPLTDSVLNNLVKSRILVDTVLIGHTGEALLRELSARTGGQFVRCSDVAGLIRHYDQLAVSRSLKK
jgi:hypothetical protein